MTPGAITPRTAPGIAAPEPATAGPAPGTTPPPPDLPAVEETASPDPSDRRALLDVLLAANAAAGHPPGSIPLALLLRDADGAVAGGLWALSYYDWLFVELLVVPASLRGRGVGTGLMRRAEAVARERGCAGVWLDTFHFQAPAFYARLGYAPFGTLEDHPRGGRRHFLSRRLG